MVGATRARALALPRQAALAGAHASLGRELWRPRPDARDRARPSRRREIRGREERRMWMGERARVGAGIYSAWKETAAPPIYIRTDQNIFATVDMLASRAGHNECKL